MKKLNRKTIGLLVTSLVLIASVGVGSALAYFTTYTEAKGGKEICLDFSETDVKEIISDRSKHITLKNTSDSDIYVRVNAYVGDEYSISYSEEEGCDNWDDENPDEKGFVYYKHILKPGEETTEILVNIDFTVNEDFNVIVVQECTPVLYDEDGAPYADWDITADVVSNKVANEDIAS